MLHHLKQSLVKWLHTRRAIAQLSLFDDHLLADVGVGREEIASRVLGRDDHSEACARQGAKKGRRDWVPAAFV